MFSSVDIFSSHLEHLISIPIICRGQQDLAAFGYASQSVFGIVGVNSGFSFCLFLDQVSVIVVDILYFISGFGVFLGDHLVIFVVGYGDGSVPIGMSALIDLTETS